MLPQSPLHQVTAEQNVLTKHPQHLCLGRPVVICALSRWSMDVVEKIAKVKTREEGELTHLPVETVMIETATRLR